jgi:uncharacterized LabA/DUF88 family protein
VPDRVVVFLDYQNVYRRARGAFHDEINDPAFYGQVNPLALAQLITSRGMGDRELKQVRVYRGRPDSAKQPVSYGTNLRQCEAWEHLSPTVSVTTRTLRYPFNWPTEKALEKGIDVSLAVDFVVMAVRGEYDVGVIMSTDTDLKPALEAVTVLRGANAYPRCEVAAWSVPGGHSRRLAIAAINLWCHWLNKHDYDGVADPTDYNVR